MNGWLSEIRGGRTCIALTSASRLACLIPALRAGRIHPMRALRGERA